MYAVENGFYHLQQGFNNTSTKDPKFKAEFCEYYRIDPSLFEVINVPEKEYFMYQLLELGIVKEWRKDAKKAIKTLETLTGKKFKSTARKEYAFKKDNSIKVKIKEGYYTPEAIKEREQAKHENKKAELIAELEDEAQKRCDKANKEKDVQVFILNAGISLNNFIYYNHTNKGVFNWKGYEKKITHEEFSAFLELPNLPNVEFEIENK